jgi:predicted  nucleic acid-binding Zn-ribbon protein
MEYQVLDELLSLQEMDGDIARSRAELRAIEEESQLLEEGLEAARQRESEVAVRVEAADRALRQYERTVQAGRATLKRLQQRAQEVAKERAAVAARAEMDAARQNLDAAETAMLEGMQVQERVRSEHQAAVEALELEQQATDERLAEISRRSAELADSISVQTDRRENRALRIDGSVRSVYDRVRAGRTSEALAPVVEGVCGHCFTSIPLQRQAEIKGGRTLIVCETCGVILHADR